MELPTPAARYLGEGDRDALARFRCSRGAWYEEDVERFVATRLVDYHESRRRDTDHTVIGLELPQHGLVAVGAHEEDLTRDGDLLLTSTYLELAAVSLPFQGGVLTDAEPLDPDGKAVSVGRWLAEVLLSDNANRKRDPVVRAVVARENRRSLALCDRIGLRHVRDDEDTRFVQRWGAIAR
ncbi:MAG TPA: hypothetical protein VGW75_02920 [Solirubrobacteraceae bacterium]|nr:hypothetical protein [Solirubrobacteraceae bacterium]